MLTLLLRFYELADGFRLLTASFCNYCIAKNCCKLIVFENTTSLLSNWTTLVSLLVRFVCIIFSAAILTSFFGCLKERYVFCWDGVTCWNYLRYWVDYGYSLTIYDCGVICCYPLCWTTEMNRSRLSLLPSALDWARFFPVAGLADVLRSNLAASLFVVELDLNLADCTRFYFVVSSAVYLSKD